MQVSAIRHRKSIQLGQLEQRRSYALATPTLTAALGRASSLSGLSQAVVKLRKMAKMLLAHGQDEAYQRRILVELNCGEGYHALARAIFQIRERALPLIKKYQHNP
jgi:TnpA family transposase